MGNKISFEAHYIKSNDYRTCYVSGVFGGLNSQGKLDMTFYLERNPIPDSIVYSVEVDGDQIMGAPQEALRNIKSGVVRESQGGLIMDIETAKGIAQWLNEKVAEHESSSLKKNSK